jgi:CubicO group peptidase (beta-lactamase class C family)
VNTEQDVIELLARQKQLNFKPGEQFEYSNSGYFLLGVIVRRVSGQSLREFAAENIFKPLRTALAKLMGWKLRRFLMVFGIIRSMVYSF